MRQEILVGIIEKGGLNFLIQLFIALSKENVVESVIRMKALQMLMKLISSFISP